MLMTVEHLSQFQPRIADARNAIRHVFVRDLMLVCRIGVHRHEELSSQRVRINLDLAVRDERALHDDLANVVCYERITGGVRALVDGRHIRLVETLAEEIAAFCLADRRVRSARVRVEKLDVFRDTGSVGVEIERFSSL
jgi:dihydroneopterin aldolase